MNGKVNFEKKLNEHLNKTNLSSRTTSQSSEDETISSNNSNSPKGLGTERKNFVLKSDFFTDYQIKNSTTPTNSKIPYKENPFFTYYYGQQPNQLIANESIPNESITNESTVQIEQKYKPNERILFGNYHKNCFSRTSEGMKREFNETKDFKRNESQEKRYDEYKIRITNKTDDRQLVEILKTQLGCRYFQNKILKNKKFANKVLYPHLKGHMMDLINDKFGNYLYQELIDVLNLNNMYHLLEFITMNFHQIAFSSHGTRVIQKLIDKIKINNKLGQNVYNALMKKVSSNVLEMSIDENANHIIRKLIAELDPKRNDFIFTEIESSFSEIATTKYGCCVIEKCIFSENENQRRRIAELILNNISLIYDQFGNYVFQCLILNGDNIIIKNVYSAIFKDFFLMSKGKYSSNAIEKLFEINNIEIINLIASRFIQKQSKLIDLVYNKYGIFIVKKLLNSVGDICLKKQILSILSENILNVNNNSLFTKNI